MQISQKGLILISLPLVFELTVFGMLSYQLSQSESAIKQQVRSREIMALDDQVQRAYSCSLATTFLYAGTRIKSFKVRQEQATIEVVETLEKMRQMFSHSRRDQAYVQDSATVLFHILTLEKKWRNLNLSEWFVPAKKEIVKRMMFMHKKRCFAGLMAREQRLSRQMVQARLEAVSSTYWIIGGSLLLMICLAFWLSQYFIRSIAVRLLNVMQNTINLSARQALNLPVSGNDEIALLDQSVYRSAAEIMELEQYRAQLTAIISHELKTPLSSLNLVLMMLSAGNFGKLSASASTQLDEAIYETETLINLIQDLLFLERIESGVFTPEPRELSLAAVLAKAVEPLKQLESRQPVRLLVAESAATVFSDEEALSRTIRCGLQSLIAWSEKDSDLHVDINSTETEVSITAKSSRAIPVNLQEQLEKNLPFLLSKSLLEKLGGRWEFETTQGLQLSWRVPATPGQSHADRLAILPVLASQLPAIAARVGGASQLPASAAHVDGASQLPIIVAGAAATSQLSSQAGVGATPCVAHTVKRARPGFAFNMKLKEKGLILVLVPIFFVITSLGIFTCVMQQADDELSKQFKARDILAEAAQAELIKWDLLCTSAIRAGCSDDAEVADQYERDKTALEQSFKTLATMTKGSPGHTRFVQIYTDISSKTADAADELVLSGLKDFTAVVKVSNDLRDYCKSKGFKSTNPWSAEDEMIENERALLDRSVQENANTRRTLQMILNGLMSLSFPIALGLAVYFNRTMIREINNIVGNSQRLLKNEPLNPPLPGIDEIAILDDYFYKVAQKLMAMRKFKQSLVAVLREEFMKPLKHVQQTLTQVSELEAATLSQKAKDRIAMGQREVRRLTKLVDELLSIEKLQVGQIELQTTEVNLAEIMDRAAIIVRPLAEDKKVSLEVSGLELSFPADPDRLIQVLVNLLSNAIKFSPEKGVVKLEASLSGDNLDLKVIDQGRGIPQALLEKIFEPFEQVEKTDASERKGTGLGLFIVKSIVEAHHGTIAVESQEGKGACFQIQLPLPLSCRQAV